MKLPCVILRRNMIKYASSHAHVHHKCMENTGVILDMQYVDSCTDISHVCLPPFEPDGLPDPVLDLRDDRRQLPLVHLVGLSRLALLQKLADAEEYLEKRPRSHGFAWFWATLMTFSSPHCSRQHPIITSNERLSNVFNPLLMMFN